jgi:hypothetical protein
MQRNTYEKKFSEEETMLKPRNTYRKTPKNILQKSGLKMSGLNWLKVGSNGRRNYYGVNHSLPEMYINTIT